MAKQPTTIHQLYGGQVQIEFRENPFHTYKLLGTNERLLSVTGVTGILDKSRVLIQWALGLAKDHTLGFLNDRGDMVDQTELRAILEEAFKKHTQIKTEAADVGTLIHAYAEAFATAKMDGTSLPPIGDDLPDQVISGINGFLDWFKAHDIKFLEVERLVYSKSLGYAGLFDALIRIDGKLMLADWKSSKGVYAEFFPQIAAYRMAYEEEMGVKLDGSLIVKFGKEDGSFEVKDISASHEADAEMFKGLLVAKNRLKEIEKELKESYAKNSSGKSKEEGIEG